LGAAQQRALQLRAPAVGPDSGDAASHSQAQVRAQSGNDTAPSCHQDCCVCPYPMADHASPSHLYTVAHFAHSLAWLLTRHVTIPARIYTVRVFFPIVPHSRGQCFCRRRHVVSPIAAANSCAPPHHLIPEQRRHASRPEETPASLVPPFISPPRTLRQILDAAACLCTPSPPPYRHGLVLTGIQLGMPPCMLSCQSKRGGTALVGNRGQPR
ncbi:hypothetical protein EDB84DRAFT_1610088, partial [Lactarius hengduanensis]